MDLVKVVENEQLKNAYPEVEIGDFVKVHLKIKEGTRERVQVFEGTVIARKGGGLSETINVRRPVIRSWCRTHSASPFPKD